MGERYNTKEKSSVKGRDIIGDKDKIKRKNSEKEKSSKVKEHSAKEKGSTKEKGSLKMQNSEKGKDIARRKTITEEKNIKRKGLQGKCDRLGNGSGREKKRAAEKCPVFKKCGGCQFLDLSYKEQLEKKQRQVEMLLKGICPVKPIIGMENPYHYRNKVHAVFSRDEKGNPISGVYKADSHIVVPVEKCLIEDEKADEIIGTIRGMLKSFKIKVYDEDTEYGLLRHVLVKRGFATNEIMVVLVTASPVFPSKNNFVKALRQKHPEITTVVQNINGRGTSMVLGEKEHVLFGKGYIEDKLCGCRFRISSKSFYQVNPVQTEILYKKAIELAELTGKELIVDAYCGIGTIGIIAAQSAKNVIGVELNKEAVRDAVNNAKHNKVSNIRFFCGDAGEFMEDMARNDCQADIVFMDPPRSGSTEAFMKAVAKLGPKRVIYISCQPETLARDLKYFGKLGYKAREAWPVDMFGMTRHVETVVMLSHKKPDSVINVKVEFGEGEGKVPLDNIAKRAEAYKPKERVTYKMIKEYIEAKYGFKVHTAYIAEVKRELGLPMYDAPNAVDELKHPRKHPTAEKVEAIKDALEFFELI
ncbi:23S rRNA (uracil(1939)-C(5))-methyltransferase RlmD [Lachnospiraceae bacterium 62-35]